MKRGVRASAQEEFIRQNDTRSVRTTLGGRKRTRDHVVGVNGVLIDVKSGEATLVPSGWGLAGAGLGLFAPSHQQVIIDKVIAIRSLAQPCLSTQLSVRSSEL